MLFFHGSSSGNSVTSIDVVHQDMRQFALLRHKHLTVYDQLKYIFEYRLRNNDIPGHDSRME